MTSPNVARERMTNVCVLRRNVSSGHAAVLSVASLDEAVISTCAFAGGQHDLRYRLLSCYVLRCPCLAANDMHPIVPSCTECTSGFTGSLDTCSSVAGLMRSRLTCSLPALLVYRLHIEGSLVFPVERKIRLIHSYVRAQTARLGVRGVEMQVSLFQRRTLARYIRLGFSRDVVTGVSCGSSDTGSLIAPLEHISHVRDGVLPTVWQVVLILRAHTSIDGRRNVYW